MKRLWLLRHAKAENPEPGTPDQDRGLTERGKRDANRVGEELARRNSRPDLIVSSSARRARKTAKRVLQHGGWDCEINLLGELYLAPPATYLRVLGRLPENVSSVLVVGHNPGLEELLSYLTGQTHGLETATIAELLLPIETWELLGDGSRADLQWYWRPQASDR